MPVLGLLRTERVLLSSPQRKWLWVVPARVFLSSGLGVMSAGFACALLPVAGRLRLAPRTATVIL